jgi:chemotaxis protein MotB
MAIKRDDTGEVISKGVVTKGWQPRRFPWRLWFFALLMTGAAGAGGYFAWQYREAAQKSSGELDSLRSSSGKDLASAKEAADKDCKGKLDAADKKTHDVEAQANQMASNLNATKDELKQLRDMKSEQDKRMAAFEDIRKQFAKMIEHGDLKVAARRNQLIISLPAEVLFPSGSADLSKQGEYSVVEVGAVLKKFPGRRFLVVGHTDNQPLGKPKDPAVTTYKDNWELSTARALTVTHVLVTAGMDPKSVIPAGEGEHDPIAANTTGEGRQRNRRIEIALLPAINELPPLPAAFKDDTAPTPAPAK